MTVTNAANLVFATNSSGGYNTGLRGIEAQAAANGTSSVTNTGNIGFTSSCSSNCGNLHLGINSTIASGTGANTVTNSGTIVIFGDTSGFNDSFAIFLNRGAQTVTNTGNITLNGIGSVVRINNPSGAATVNFNGGTVTSDDFLVNVFSGNVGATVNFNGGTATGKLSLTSRNDTVNVNSGGTLTLANGTSDFAAGTDSLSPSIVTGLLTYW